MLLKGCPFVCTFLFHVVLKVEFLLLKGTVKVLKPLALLGKFFARCYPQFCPCSSDWTWRSLLGCRSGTSRCIIFTLLGWRPLVAVGPGCREFWWKRFPPQLGLNDLKWLLFISSLRFALFSSSTTSLRVEKGSSVSLLCTNRPFGWVVILKDLGLVKLGFPLSPGLIKVNFSFL